MKIIGIGDLVTDRYYVNGEFVGACGGMTAFNIIANLSSKFKTYAVGRCGNDKDGEIAKKSLEDLKVNIDNLICFEKQTRCFNVNVLDNNITSKKRCLICNRKKWYDKPKERINIPEKLLKENDTMLIFDTLNEENIKLVIKSKEKNCLNAIDMGQVGILDELDKNEIVDKLNNKFDFVQLNERVFKFLKEKLEIENAKDLNKIFNAKLLTITYGKKGAEFTYNNKNYEYKMQAEKELDPTGAGDLFFSIVLEFIINNNLVVNKTLLNKIFKQATEQTSKLVTKIGARALVQDLYKVEIEKNKCICGLELDNKKEEKKAIKKISSNLSNLGKRIKSNFSSNAYNEVKEMICNLDGNTLVCGTGGSFASSYFAAKVINLVKGICAEAEFPRDVFYKNIDSYKNIIAFSYSGTTNDILKVLEYAKNKNKYVITKGKQKNEEFKVISYLNSKSKTVRERGFLSIEGTVFPAALFAKYYYSEVEKKIDFEDFIQNRLVYWRDYFKNFFKENNMKVILKNKNILDVFYGDYTTTAAIDLESKIVETGTYRATFHEKKNFSHGRFISVEHYNSDATIYLQTNDSNNYEKNLLNYLENKVKNLIIIKAPFNGLIGEFDLLLAMQYFIKNIAETLDIDLSKPEYSEESMTLYKYKGNLN